MMTRYLSAGLTVLALVSSTPAQAPSHLELVRGLRASGMADLAEEYLNLVMAKLSKEELAVVPLEMARIIVEKAAQEADEPSRTRLLREAQSSFNEFVRKNPNHPRRPQVSLEIAKLIASQGQAALIRASKSGKEARDKEAPKTREAYASANEKLREAVKEIDAQLGKLAGSDDKALIKELTESKFVALLEEASNTLNSSLTFTGTSGDERKKRADGITAAKKLFSALFNSEGATDSLKFVAHAWSAYCDDLNDESAEKVRDVYEGILADRSPHSMAAKRLAKYFRMRQLYEKPVTAPKNQNAQQLALKMARDWLNEYSAYRNTLEGIRVKYFLGQMLQNAAAAGITMKDNKPVNLTSAATMQLKEASGYFREIAEGDNEYAERATDRRQQILFILASVQGKKDPSQIKTFEECYLLAQVELAEYFRFVRDKGKDNPEAQQKEMKARFGKAIDWLERGLTIQPKARDRDEARDMIEARVALIYSHLNIGNLYQAAILGEHFARTNPKLSRASAGAYYALLSYSQIISKLKNAPEGARFPVTAEEARIKDLATYLEATWPNDPSTDYARMLLGSLYRAERNYVKSIDAFHRVTANFPGLGQVRFEQGAAAFDLIRLKPSGNLTEQIQKDRFEKTVKDIQALSYPEESDSFETIYFNSMAKLQLALLLVLERKRWAEVEEIGTKLKAVLPKAIAVSGKDVPPNVAASREDILSRAEWMRLVGIQGQAFELSEQGKHPEVLKRLETTLAAITKEAASDTEDTTSAAGNKMQTKRAIVLLAMKSCVQDNKLDQANTLFDLLEKLSQKEVGLEGKSDPLMQILGDIMTQIRYLKERKETEKLKAFTDGVTKFLEEREKKPNIPDKTKFFLSVAYNQLGNPKKAADLLAKIAPVPQPKPDAPPEVQAKFADYKRVVLERLRALRQSKELDAAEKLFKEVTAVDPKDPKKAAWGAANLDIRKEGIFIKEDRGQFKAALDEWTNMRNQLKPPPEPKELAAEDITKLIEDYAKKIGKDPNSEEVTNKVEELVTAERKRREEQKRKHDDLKELGNEIFFYMQRLVLRSTNASKTLKPEQKSTRIEDLAKKIIEIDDKILGAKSDKVREMYRDMISGDPILKSKYESLGGKLLK